MGKLVWRVKLVAETGGPATEIEVARIEREDWAVPETLGLSLDEAKELPRLSRLRLSARKHRR